MLLDPVLNFQISLMLRTKVFTCIFLHHGCHALRSNQRLNIISSSVLCSKMVSSVFQHSTISDSMVQELLMFFFTFYPHWCYALWLSFVFSPVRPSLVLRCKIFSSNILDVMLWRTVLSSIFQNNGSYAPRSSLHIFKHHWCHASRSSLQFSHIIDATLLRSKIFSTFWHHACCALRSSFQYSSITYPWLDDLVSIFCSTIIDAIFLDPVLNFQLSLMLRAKVFTCIF